VKARKATEADIPYVTVLGEEFWSTTAFEEESDTTSIYNAAKECFRQGLLAVLEEDGEVVGFVAGLAHPLLGNNKVKAGGELAYYIDPDFRKGRGAIELMKQIETQAKDIGVKYWTMVSMECSHPEVAESIYTRLGYNKFETSFTRIL
jgi:GNAT superfamily N-acetyltransferase